MERVQTVAQGLTQATSSIVFNRSTPITSIPEDIRRESPSAPIQSSQIEYTTIDQSILQQKSIAKPAETELILNLPQESKAEVFKEKLGSINDPLVQRRRVEEIRERAEQKEMDELKEKLSDVEIFQKLPGETKQRFFEQKLGTRPEISKFGEAPAVSTAPVPTPVSGTARTATLTAAQIAAQPKPWTTTDGGRIDEIR